MIEGNNAMRKLLLGFVALVAALHAADITGTWSGPMKMTKDGETKDDSAYLVLKQSGNEVSGTIGPNAEQRLTITKGTIDGSKIYIEAVVQGENRMVLKLTLDGEKLVGDLSTQGPEAPPLTGKMTLSREK